MASKAAAPRPIGAAAGLPAACAGLHELKTPLLRHWGADTDLHKSCPGQACPVCC